MFEINLRNHGDFGHQNVVASSRPPIPTLANRELRARTRENSNAKAVTHSKKSGERPVPYRRKSSITLRRCGERVGEITSEISRHRGGCLVDAFECGEV